MNTWQLHLPLNASLPHVENAVLGLPVSAITSALLPTISLEGLPASSALPSHIGTS